MGLNVFPPTVRAKAGVTEVAYYKSVMLPYGAPAASDGGYNSGCQPLDISPAAAALLKPGATVVLAAHVRQTTGGQGIDIGLASLATR